MIIATFGADGPETCSGLPLMRYQPKTLHAEFGNEFMLVGHEQEAQHTPSGAVQQFVYCYCRLGSSDTGYRMISPITKYVMPNCET